MLRNVASRHVALCHVISRHVMSRHVMSRHVMYLMSRHGTPCHVMSYHVMSRHVTSRHVMSHLAPSCHVMSYHVTSYHVESRGTVTRPTLHCQLTSSTRNQFKLSMTVFVGCPEGCRYNTASAVYDLVINYCMHVFDLYYDPCTNASVICWLKRLLTYLHTYLRFSTNIMSY